ncbi:MAG: CDP-alcohol phosphatidyltransferase family protein [Acidobacteriota bacterium]
MSVTVAVRKSGREFVAAKRVHGALTASPEKRALVWMAQRAPRWVTSDGLTMLGLSAQIGAGACYALSRWSRWWLVAGIVCMALNWLGDSLDGTVARVRQQQRPRYGFYVDHIVDVVGAVALMSGLACSGLVHWQVAMAMLIAFLVLSSESFLATYTLGSFEMSQGWFGPTELRILLAMANVALLRSPYSVVMGHRWLLFDFGGTIGVVGMSVMAVATIVRHTAELYRQEPLAGAR